MCIRDSNNIVSYLEAEGAEVILPNMMDFFLYAAYDEQVKRRLLDGTLGNVIKSKLFMKFLDYYRKPLNIALQKSKRFSAYEPLSALIALAEKHLSTGNMAGEGWLLTAEMAKLLRSGIDNICVLYTSMKELAAKSEPIIYKHINKKEAEKILCERNEADRLELLHAIDDDLLLTCYTSVSYTHLDVYKRQPILLLKHRLLWQEALIILFLAGIFSAAGSCRGSLMPKLPVLLKIMVKNGP